MAKLTFKFDQPIDGIKKMGVYVATPVLINHESGVCQGTWYDIIFDANDPAYAQVDELGAPVGAIDFRTPHQFTILLDATRIQQILAPVAAAGMEQGVLRVSAPAIIPDPAPEPVPG